MKKAALAVGVVALGISAQASAQFTITGADTLEDLSRALITPGDPGFCAGATNLLYNGAGSGPGGTAVINGFQWVAPQSRKLNEQECSTPTFGGRSQAIGLDILTVARGTTTANGSCNGLAFSGSVPLSDLNSIRANVRGTLGAPGIQPAGIDNPYVLADWKDVLRVLYFGIHHNGAFDCNSDVRHSLVNNWSKVFQAPCAGESCCCVARPVTEPVARRMARA